MARYAYRNIRTPILEHTRLFVRSIGEVTDIVEKEMYSFEDRADKHGDAEHLSMRPENTASVVRAITEHNLLYDGGKRLYYMGPMFRRERPQRGRYRQFHQIGAETLDFAGPEVDAELILLAAALWRELGLTDWRLEINSLGQPEERAQHRAQLIAYLEQHLDQLDEEARRRLHSNPLRILDTKNPAMQDLVNGAPRLIDFLGAASLAHFEGLKAMLDANGVPWTLNPRLVRGLDYYNRTVFEWVTDQLGAQGTVCAGGRYDGLVEQLGGKPAPAAGFAMGIERLLALMETAGSLPPSPAPDAYIVHAGTAAEAHAWRVAGALRGAGLAAVLHCGGGSFKSQMKKADASRARYAVIIGDDEAAAGQLTLKPLRDATEQVRVDVAQAIESLKKA